MQDSVVVVYVMANFLTVRATGVMLIVFVVSVGLPSMVLVPVATIRVTVPGVTVVSVCCVRIDVDAVTR